MPKTFKSRPSSVQSISFTSRENCGFWFGEFVRQYWFILLLLCCFQVCYGQLTDDEAKRRMEELNRRAPVQTPEKRPPPQPKRIKVWRAKDDAPPFVRIWSARLDDLRAWQIDAVKQKIDAEKARLAEIQRRPIPMVPARDGFIVGRAPDAAAQRRKTDDVRAAEKSIQSLWKEVHELENPTHLPLPELPWRIGGFGICHAECTVLQVINSTNFLLEIERTSVWLEGKFPGIELAGDGGTFNLNSFVLIKDLKTYTTITNFQRQVPRLVLVDYLSYFEQIDVDETEALTRIKNAKKTSPASLALLVQSGIEEDPVSRGTTDPLKGNAGTQARDGRGLLVPKDRVSTGDKR
jgi:hypothetical protein